MNKTFKLGALAALALGIAACEEQEGEFEPVAEETPQPEAGVEEAE